MNTLNKRLGLSVALAASLSIVAYQETQQPAATIDPATLQSQLAPVSDTTEPTPIN